MLDGFIGSGQLQALANASYLEDNRGIWCHLEMPEARWNHSIQKGLVWDIGRTAQVEHLAVEGIS